MKSKRLLAVLPVICLCWPANPVGAQAGADAGTVHLANVAPRESPAYAVGPCRIRGVLKDPAGALVPDARVEVKNLTSGFKRSAVTDQQGRFFFDALPAGRYRLKAIAAGFEIAVLPVVAVADVSETISNVTLKIAPVKSVVEVTGSTVALSSATRRNVDDGDRTRPRNAAELLEDVPGASLRENGQLASIPILHGLGDERTRVVMDGMTVSSACAGHMNPPLSYLAPSHASEVTVMAGIAPVSVGGDSLGGTIAIDSRLPVFADAGERLHEEGAVSGFYRSNDQDHGGALKDWVAGRHLGIGYLGSWTTNDDYTDGSGHKVTSTYAQSTDHVITIAARSANRLAVVQAGLHQTPYEGFANARMDMVRNKAESLNLRFRRSFEEGSLDGHLYWQSTWHTMNIGRDKASFPMPMNMPMNTHGRDLGYSVKLEIPLTDRHTLRLGNELHRFVLDDTWPAVAGTAPMMGPGTFVNISDGRRIRLGSFIEVASVWKPKWTTLAGLRNDTVWTNAGPVQGYSEMYSADATAFNALDRAHTDPELEATALARYEPNASSGYEIGYARKARAPNLYERYAWSTNKMASSMIGWFGDGNYYVGNSGLKPEIAHTVSGTATWHGRPSREWEIKLAPYMTRIQDFVDADALGTITYGMSNFAQLRFANHNAAIHGADLSGSATIWNNSRIGVASISGVGGWLHGTRLDAQTPLYQMMPLNLRLSFDERLKGFAAGLGIQAVDRKSNVDTHRFEQTTPGYTLFNLHAGYQRGHLRATAAADNLLNKEYELPMGGVNLDDFMAGMRMGQIKPLTGRGRSAYVGLSLQFR